MVPLELAGVKSCVILSTCNQLAHPRAMKVVNEGLHKAVAEKEKALAAKDVELARARAQQEESMKQKEQQFELRMKQQEEEFQRRMAEMMKQNDDALARVRALEGLAMNNQQAPPQSGGAAAGDFSSQQNADGVRGAAAQG